MSEWERECAHAPIQRWLAYDDLISDFQITRPRVELSYSIIETISLSYSAKYIIRRKLSR